jgi:hypothetical protein
MVVKHGQQPPQEEHVPQTVLLSDPQLLHKWEDGLEADELENQQQLLQVPSEESAKEDDEDVTAAVDMI